MTQIDIDFEPGLLEQFPRWLDCVRDSVYGCGKALKTVAADIDMTSTELSRKLADNPNDNVHFPLEKLPELIRATGNKNPVHWLIASFLECPIARRRRAKAQLMEAMPRILALLEAAEEPVERQERPTLRSAA